RGASWGGARGGRRRRARGATRAGAGLPRGRGSCPRRARAGAPREEHTADWTGLKVMRHFTRTPVDRQRKGGDVRTIGIFLAGSVLTAAVILAAGCGGSSSSSADQDLQHQADINAIDQIEKT